MNLNDVRNMSDKELNSFLAAIQKDERRICNKCGEFILDKRTLTVRRDQTTRTLCTLCNSCYIDLLEYLGINDVQWN